jgi:hypothetical protein
MTKMTTDSIKTTIRLGSIRLEVYQLEDGSYSAPGLFRLVGTCIYRYGECWYWLGYGAPPDMKDCKFWGRRGDVFLALQSNKLCHLYVNPADPEGALYVPIPGDLQSVIEFCILGKLATDNVMLRLNKVLDRLCLVRKGFIPAIISGGLLEDTATYLPGVEGSAPDAKSNTTSSTTDKSKCKKSRTNTGSIYLVKLDSYLKLGFTRNLSSRLSTFKNTNVRVDLIKTVEGTLWMEKRLHSMLGSKKRELYDFDDEQRIIEAMSQNLSRRKH